MSQLWRRSHGSASKSNQVSGIRFHPRMYRVNKYVLYSEKVTIVAIGLKFAMSVHTSFCSVCRKSGLILLVDSEVVAACVPGICLQL